MRTVSRLLRLAMAGLVLWTAGCARTDVFGPSSTTEESSTPRTVTLVPATQTLGLGRSVQFVAQAAPAKPDDQFQWTLTPPNAGTLTPDGIYTAPTALPEGVPTDLQVTVRATLVGDNVSATARVTVVPIAQPPAAKLVKISGDEQSGVVGQPLAQPFMVQAVDMTGTPVANIRIHFASPLQASDSVDAVTGADGYAKGLPNAGPVAGKQTFVVSSEGLNPLAFTATLAAGPVAKIIVTHPNPTGLHDTDLYDPATVSFRDQFGNPLEGHSATVTTTAANGKATPITTSSDSNGNEFYAIHLGSVVGVEDFVFTDTQNPDVSGKLTFTVSGGIPATVKIVSGNQQTGTVGQQLQGPLVIQVLDANGQPVPGVMVTWSTPDGGSFAQVSMLTDGSGQAAAVVKLGQKAVLQKFVIDAGHIANSPLTFLEQALAGPATQLILAGGAGQTTGAGAPFGTAFSVLAADQFGNPVQNVPVVFQVVSGGGSISPTNVTTDATGLGQATMVAGPAGGQQVYRATSPMIMGPQVDLVLQATQPTPLHVEIVSGAGQMGQVGTDLPQPLVVRVTRGGTPVANQAVTFGVIMGDGSVRPVTVNTDAMGVAQTTAHLGSQPGAERFSATVPGADNSPVFFDETAQGQTVVGLKIISGAGQTGPVNSALPQPLVVIAIDANGAPVPNAPIIFTPPANAQVGTPTTTTDGQGQASTTALLGPQAGDQLFVASSGNVTATFRETAVMLSEHLTLVSGDGQMSQVGTPLAQPLVVQLTDDAGNPVVGVEVDWASSVPSIGLSSAVTRTDAMGFAQITVQLGQTVGMQQITASVAGAQGSPVTFTEVGTPAPPALLTIVSGNNQTALPSAPLPVPLTVKVSDALGNGVANITVTFAVGMAGGTLSQTSVATAMDGTASVSATLGATGGTYTFTASVMGLAGSPATFTETAALNIDHISISPAGQMLQMGGSVSYTATAVFKDGTTQDITNQATWSSSNPMVATVSDQSGAKGVTVAQGPGTATISASFGGSTGTTTVSVASSGAKPVSIDLEPANATVAVGTSVQFTATATYSDGSVSDVTESATWTSSDITIATASDTLGTKGLVAGTSAGSTTITVTLMGITASRTVKVTQSNIARLEIAPSFVSQPAGTTVNFTATATYKDGTVVDVTTQVTWTSSDPTLLQVDSGGHARLVAAGTPTLTVQLSTGETATITVNITGATLVSLSIRPGNVRMALNDVTQLQATGTYSDGTVHDVTTSVAWSTSDKTIADVSNAAGSQGVVTALAQGQATITATLGGQQAAANVSVDNAMAFVVRIYQPAAGGGFPNFNNNYDCEPGTSITLHAGALYQGGPMGGRIADITTNATWSSSDPTIASVGQGLTDAGIVQCLKAGSVTISASYQGQADQATVTVANSTVTSIALVPTSASLHIGDTQPFHATATYSDGKTADLTTVVTWMSTDSTIAAVSNASGYQGVVSGVGAGMATITASYGGVTGQATVSVSNAHLKLIVVAPTNPSVQLTRRNRNYKFTATAVYDDNSQQDITTISTWSSSNVNVADVSNTGTTIGTAQLVGTGSTTISASYQGMTGSTTLNVY